MTPERHPIGKRLQHRITEVETFFRRDLWISIPETGIKRFLFHILRMGVLIGEGLVRGDFLTLSAALTFKVIFAMMPLLAVTLALFKGFGGFSNMGDQVKDFIFRRMGMDIGEGFTSQLDGFISNINATAIGAIGFLLLAYTAISLLDNIEKAFNRMWGIRTPRPILRRITVYWTMLTLAPVLLAGSLAMSAFVQNHSLFYWLNAHVPGFGSFVLHLTPFVFAWILFTGLYVFMPNTKVKIGAAFIGAFLAGSTWELMKTGYVWYNAQVVTNYKFYGSLGAVPVFLMWVYLSWVIVLVGSEIAFAAQHVKTYRREVEEFKISQADRERLALVLCLHVVRPFEAGSTPPTATAIAGALNAPVRVMNDVAFQLLNKGVLRETVVGEQKDPGLIPGRDPSILSVRDVVEAIRSYGDPCALPNGKETAALYKIVDDAHAHAGVPLEKVTLKQLAAGGS